MGQDQTVGRALPARRVILHVDMDAFFAAVEQHDRPELKGLPVIVGAPRDRRGVVCAASYEARVFGVHSALPSREAARRCPQGVFLPPRMRRYSEISRQVFHIFERFTPLVQGLSIDEAFLDVTGARRLHGTGPEIAAKIRAAIRAETGLTASVGVAPNMFLAKIASDLHKPDGLTVVPDEPGAVRAFLAPLPAGRLWGVGQVTQAVLEKAGLRTIADLQALDAARLADLVGAGAAAHLKRLADGRDDREVETGGEEKSISREYTFDEDCTDAARIARVLMDLTDDVGGRLRASGRYATVARLKLRWKGFETHTRQRRLDPPCCDDFRLRAAAGDLLGGMPLTRPVRLVGFGVSGLVAHAAVQLSLFDGAGRAPGRQETVSHTVDEIRRRFGPASIRRAGGIAKENPNAPRGGLSKE